MCRSALRLAREKQGQLRTEDRKRSEGRGREKERKRDEREKGRGKERVLKKGERKRTLVHICRRQMRGGERGRERPRGTDAKRKKRFSGFEECIEEVVRDEYLDVS